MTVRAFAAGALLGLGALGLFVLLREPEPPVPLDLSRVLVPDPGSLRDRSVARILSRVADRPEDADAWTALGDALLERGRETDHRDDYEHAERAYRWAGWLRPDHNRAALGLSSVHAGRGELEDSRRWATHALRLDPTSPEGHGLLGDAALETGDYELARKEYQTMIQLGPDGASYRRMARLSFLVGNVARARVLLGKAIESVEPDGPDGARYRVELALLNWSVGARVPAEDLIRDVLEERPEDAFALAALGRIEASKRNYGKAIELYQRAAAHAPRPETFASLAELLTLVGRREDAATSYGRAEAAYRARPDRGGERRALLYANGNRNLAEALRDAEVARAARPNVYVYDALAWCYYKLGRHEEARRAIGEALRLGTPEASFLFHAGRIEAALGNVPRARRLLYQALSLNPDFDPVDAPAAADALATLGRTGASPSRP